MKTMKKTIAVSMAALLLSAGCSSGATETPKSESGGDAGAVKNVTIWAWDPNFNIAALNKAKEAYQAKKGDANINIVENAQADIIQKLNAGLNSGTTKGLPNIVLIEDLRAQSFLSSYPDAFYDLSSAIKGTDFADYKAGPTSFGGKQYGVPFDSGVTGFYYRTDYLEQAGFKADDLKNITWDRFIEIGKAVKAKTGKAMISLDPNDLGIIRVMIQSSGSWYLDKDGKTPTLAGNKDLKEAFETYKKMMEADIVRMHSDWSQFVAGFNNGEVASVPTGNWITPSIKAAKDQSGKWAVAPIPKMAGNAKSVNASNLGGSSWYVLNVPGKEAAADFLAKTFSSDADLYQKLVTDVGALGTLKAASSGTAYEKADEFFGGQKITADFAEWTKQIPNVNYGMHTYAVEDILVVEMQNYLNGKEIDKVLSDAQAQAQSQLK